MVNSMNTLVISCYNDMTMVYNDMTIVFNYAYHDITTKTIGVSNCLSMQRGKKNHQVHTLVENRSPSCGRDTRNIWGFPDIRGTSNWMVFVGETPIKMD